MKSNYARLTSRNIDERQLRVITTDSQKCIAFFSTRPEGSM